MLTLVEIIESREQAHKLIDKLYYEPTALDTEVIGIDTKKQTIVNRGQLFLMSLSNRQGTWIVPFESIKYFKFWFESNSPKYLANWKFDAHVLKNHGWDLKGVRFDVILADWLANENKHHDLKALGSEIGFEMQSFKKEFKRELNLEWQENRSKVITYVAKDARATFKLVDVLGEKLKDEGLDEIYKDYLLPFGQVLFEMERSGVSLNQSYLEEKSKKADEKIKEIEEEINSISKQPINLRSTKDLRRFLYKVLKLPIKKTTKGLYCKECGKVVTKATNYKCKTHDALFLVPVPSTDEETLKQFASNEVVKKILKWRELEKLNSTYLKGLAKHIINGKVHTSFSQIGTVTGRLSSSFPNCQNIPRPGEDEFKIRAAFVPEKGKVFLKFDYNQIELRLAAHFSKDPLMIEAFLNNQDIHSFTAKKIFKLSCSVEKVKELYPRERSFAKGVNFGILYGESEFGLSRRLQISKQEAKSHIESFFSEYKHLKYWMKAVISFCKQNGFVKTILGRKRRLPEIEADDFAIRHATEKKAINSPIQGSAADVIMSAMLKLHNEPIMKGLDCKMLLQVHDEILFECPEENAERAAFIIKGIMENPLDYSLRVPLIVDYKITRNWADE